MTRKNTDIILKTPKSYSTSQFDLYNFLNRKKIKQVGSYILQVNLKQTYILQVI